MIWISYRWFDVYFQDLLVFSWIYYSLYQWNVPRASGCNLSPKRDWSSAGVNSWKGVLLMKMSTFFFPKLIFAHCESLQSQSFLVFLRLWLDLHCSSALQFVERGHLKTPFFCFVDIGYFNFRNCRQLLREAQGGWLLEQVFLSFKKFTWPGLS